MRDSQWGQKARSVDVREWGGGRYRMYRQKVTRKKWGEKGSHRH